MTQQTTDTDSTDRLYVYCHECERRLGIALHDAEARVIADQHGCGAISAAEEPAEQ